MRWSEPFGRGCGDLHLHPVPHRAFPAIFLVDTGCGCLWVCRPLSGTGAFAHLHGPSSHCGPHLLRVPTTEGPNRHFTFSVSEGPGVTVALISSAPPPGVTGSWGWTEATTSSSNQTASVSTCTRVCRLPQEMEKHVKCIRLKPAALKDPWVACPGDLMRCDCMGHLGISRRVSSTPTEVLVSF